MARAVNRHSRRHRWSGLSGGWCGIALLCQGSGRLAVPTTRATMERDPYLAPPEVCDWLLSLQWTDPVTVRLRSPNGPATLFNCCETYGTFVGGEEAELLLPALALEALRKDQAARAAAEQNQPADELVLASEQAKAQEKDQPVDDAEPGMDALKGLADKLLKVIRDTDAPIPVSIAALEAAKALFLSQVYDLRPRPEVTP